MRIARLALAYAALALASPFPQAIAADATPMTDADDPYLWLESVDSPRALDWVKAENARTLGVLEADPRFAPFHAQALAIAENRDRIPYPSFLAGALFNFWQDPDHVRGLWRRTSLESYGGHDTRWQTVLDLDQLAAAEKANWVWHGADCLEPSQERCLVSLSDGGEDAVTVREFDLRAARFVAGGFTLPKGKQRVAWQDEGTLLVAREWSTGELTSAGYPFIVKRWRRGTPLESAVEVFRGSASDGGYGVTPFALHDGAGHQALFIERPLSTFEAERYVVTRRGVERLALPAKVDVLALVDNELMVFVKEPWSPAGSPPVPQGALVRLALPAVMADPAHLAPRVLWAPGPREAFQEAAATRDALLVHSLDNVRGRVTVYRRGHDGAWQARPLELPDNATTTLVDADSHSGRFLVDVSSFLQPSTLLLAEAGGGAPRPLRQLAPQFDASGDVAEQFEATASDGTKVPYFIVHPRGMVADGSHATLLYAYGGFEVSRTPGYSGTLGKLWLEHGGVYVLANIRGGGEFGPAWHEAGLKTRRQLVFDDFTAVARDLIARGITSPRRLGIQGGSNGGLLMGVQLTQHPELWNAVDIQVPLLDMLRFEQIAAGPSWVGEYGSVSVPAERAFLARISPYHALRRGQAYPMPFIWTTTKDDRVGPQHARKFAARLSEYGIPYLYYEVIEGGHGAGANLREMAHTRALEMTYFTRQLVD